MRRTAQMFRPVGIPSNASFQRKYAMKPFSVPRTMLRITMYALMTFLASGMSAYAQTNWPAAPFLLSRPLHPNWDIFRMDHVAGCPGSGLEQETLFLEWQASYWLPPYLDRNDSTDTIRYEVNFIVESLSGPGTITVPFRSYGDGLGPLVWLGGDELYEHVFRPPVPHPLEPDTIVIRVPWFVRAWNSVGSTYSDTAGITIRNDPLPTPALVMSYNRPPSGSPPTMLQPQDGAVVTGINSTTPPLDFIWAPSFDRNIQKGEISGVFKVYNPIVRSWEIDHDRTVDTLTYQWVGTVVHTAPAGKGTPIGTVLARETGRTTGVQLLPADIDMLFGGLTPPPTAMTADTVVIDYVIYVKDFNLTNFMYFPVGQQTVTFRYSPDGTLYPDTAKWSRFGCRPHEQLSTMYRITLVRDGIVGVEEDVISTPSDFSVEQTYPNPFAASTSVNYILRHAAQVQIDICDALGRSIKILMERVETSGVHQVTWDGTDHSGHRMPAGVYLVRLRGGGNVQTRSVTLLR